MIYEPFFDMNVLLTSNAITSLQVVAAVAIFFHAIFVIYFISKTVKTFKKSGLQLAPKRG